MMKSSKCNCGLPVRYTTFGPDGEMTGSCNKHAQCLTYDALLLNRDELFTEKNRYKAALEKITHYIAMDYEYRAWAKGALDGK